MARSLFVFQQTEGGRRSAAFARVAQAKKTTGVVGGQLDRRVVVDQADCKSGRKENQNAFRVVVDHQNKQATVVVDQLDRRVVVEQLARSWS